MKALSLLVLLLMMGLPIRADETYSAAFDASMARARAKYPEAAIMNSPFTFRMQQIFIEWRDAGDPRASSPNGPEMAAEAVAVELADYERRLAKRARRNAVKARPAAPVAPVVVPRQPTRPTPPPWVRERDDTVISAGPPPSSATVYGADGEIRRVFSTGTGTTTIWGPEGFTRIHSN